MLAALALAFAGCGSGSESAYRDPLGVWWWSDSMGSAPEDMYLDFAAENGVTEIYYSSSKFNDGVEEFIRKANAKGMDVYWLGAKYQWLDDSAPLYELMDKYVAFCAERRHTFKGVHLDIEPQQHPEFRTGRRQELMVRLIELCSALRERHPDIFIEYDIPFWMEDEVSALGRTAPAFTFMIDNASRVTIMSYRDTAQKIYSVASAELEYAQSVGKTVNLGVNVYSTESDEASFAEEGRQQMYRVISELRSMIPKGYVVVIHQIKRWYELPDVVEGDY